MFKNLVTVVCIILLFILLRKMLGRDPTEVAKDGAFNMIGYIGNLNRKLHLVNQQKEKLTQEKTFNRSKIHNLYSTIIVDLGLRDVTVEGFISMLILGSFFINLILYLYIKSMMLFIFGTIGIFIFLTTIAYMLSGRGHFEKEYAIMDAQDILAASMERGFYIAVKENIDAIPEVIREDFQIYLQSIQRSQQSGDEALRILSESLGPSFYKYGEKVREYTKLGTRGTLETFKDDTALNSKRRVEMMKLERTLQEYTRVFIQTLGITGGIAVLLLCSNPLLVQMLVGTLLGRLAIVAIASVIIGGFAWLQSLRNGGIS